MDITELTCTPLDCPVVHLKQLIRTQLPGENTFQSEARNGNGVRGGQSNCHLFPTHMLNQLGDSQVGAGICPWGGQGGDRPEAQVEHPRPT